MIDFTSQRLSLGVSSLALALGALGCADAPAPARTPEGAGRSKALTQEEMATRFEELLARENGPFDKHAVSFLDGKVEGTVEAASKPTVDCHGSTCEVKVDLGRDGGGEPNSIVCAVTTEITAFGPLVSALVADAQKSEPPSLTTRATSEGLAVSFATNAVAQNDDHVTVMTPKAAALYGRGYTALCHDRMAGGRATFARVASELFESLHASGATANVGVFSAGFHSRSGERENGFRFDLVANRDGDERGYHEVSMTFGLEEEAGKWKTFDAIHTVSRDATGNVQDMQRLVWIQGKGPLRLSAKPAEARKMRVKLEVGSIVNAIEVTPPAKASSEVWSAPELLAVSSGRAPSYTFSIPALVERDPALERVTVKRAAPGILQVQRGTTKRDGRDDIEMHVDDRGLVKKVVGSAYVTERLFTWGELPMGRARIAGGGASRGAK